MVQLQTTIQDSLAGLTDSQLETLTAQAGAYSTAGWLRFVTRLDLPAVLGGEIELSFAVVTADETPVAVVPVVRARGRDLVPYYSIRRNYFEYWIEDELRNNPESAADLQRAARFIARIRRTLEWLGCSIDDFLLVCSPLTYQTRIPIAADAPVSPADVYRELIESVQRHAADVGRPLAFLYVRAGDESLSAALRAAECQPVFTFYESHVDLANFQCFDDYLRSFSRKMRQMIEREIRHTVKAGIDFHFESDFANRADLLTQLYDATSNKHARDFFRHPPQFWRALSESLNGQAQAMIATQNERIVGFSMSIENTPARELESYRIGRDYSIGRGSFFMFRLLMYEPIRHAIGSGFRTMGLGPANYQAKSIRGAVQSSLYNWFWFPQRRDRWLLAPYLQRAGRLTRRELEKSAGCELRIEDHQPRWDET